LAYSIPPLSWSGPNISTKTTQHLNELPHIQVISYSVIHKAIYIYKARSSYPENTEYCLDPITCLDTRNASPEVALLVEQAPLEVLSERSLSFGNRNLAPLEVLGKSCVSFGNGDFALLVQGGSVSVRGWVW
jgi:hypothetical protein